MASKVVAWVLALVAGAAAENKYGIECNFYVDLDTQSQFAIDKCMETDYADASMTDYASRYTCSDDEKLMLEAFADLSCSGEATYTEDVSSLYVFVFSYSNSFASVTLTELLFTVNKCTTAYATRTVDQVADTCMLVTNSTSAKISCSSTKNWAKYTVYTDSKCKSGAATAETELTCETTDDTTGTVKSYKYEGCGAAQLSALVALCAALIAVAFA